MKLSSVIGFVVAAPIALLTAFLISVGLEGLRRWFRARYRRITPRTLTPWDDESDPGIGWTYHIWDETEKHLLYVGSAKYHPFGRLADHVRKEWWPDNAVVYLDKHRHYAAAHDAEITYIQDNNPFWNRVRYTSKHVSRPKGELTPVRTYRLTVERLE